MLLTLPEETVLSICIQWLTVVDLVNLDSATCHRSERRKLHSLFQSPNFLVSQTPSAVKLLVDQQRQFFRWLGQRALRLQQLSVFDTNLSCEEFQLVNVSRLENLEVKHFFGPRMKSKGSRIVDFFTELLIRSAGKLKILKLTMHHAWMTDHILTMIANYCPSLENLDISSNFLLCGLSLNYLAAHCRHLSVLNFSASSQLNQDLFNASLPYFTRMKELHLRGTSFFSNETTISSLADRCFQSDAVKLEVLDIADTTLMLQSQLHPSIFVCGPLLRNLKQFNISSFANVDDAAIHCVAERAPQLQQLEVISCSLLTGQCLNSLLIHCPLLCHVNINHCSGIIDSTVTDFIMNYERTYGRSVSVIRSGELWGQHQPILLQI